MDDSKQLLAMMTSGLKNLDVGLKQVVVKHKPHKRSAKKECYNNSWRYIQDHYNEKAKYILGYLLYMGVPIEHAWVKVGTEHFDVTLDPKNDDEYWQVCEVPDDLLAQYVDVEGHAPDLYALNRFNAPKK